MDRTQKYLYSKYRKVHVKLKAAKRKAARYKKLRNAISTGIRTWAIIVGPTTVVARFIQTAKAKAVVDLLRERLAEKYRQPPEVRAALFGYYNHKQMADDACPKTLVESIISDAKWVGPDSDSSADSDEDSLFSGGDPHEDWSD